MKSAFAGFDERLRLVNPVIKPGFATARAISDAMVPADMLAGAWSVVKNSPGKTR